MKPLVKKLLSLAITSSIGVSGAAFATNGYFLPGYGAKALGMGGVGVAYAQDSLAAAANPAGIVDVGSRADLGGGLFNPERESHAGKTATSRASETGFGGTFNEQATSKNRLYLLPSAGMTMAWDDRISIGMAMIGNGGMNTTYEPNIFDPNDTNITAKTLGVDLMQMLIPITVAYKLNDEHAIGLSLVLGAQRFSARGLEAFLDFNLPTDPAYFTGNGNDYSTGAGFRFGWRGKFLEDRLTLGATYATKVYMQKFTKYKSLFAGGGNFDVPVNYAIGIAFKPIEDLTLAMDVERILYGGVPSVANRGPDTNPVLPTSSDPSKKLGLDNGMGFGWRDQTVFKFGVDYQYNKDWKIRAGYNYGKSTIPDDQLAFNLLLPATVEDHFTAGFTYELGPENELTMSILYAPTKRQQRCGLVVVKCAAIEMHQTAVDFSYAWKF